SPAQRSSTKLLVEPFLHQELVQVLPITQVHTLFSDPGVYLGHQEVDDLMQLGLTKRVEDHNLIDTIQELWPESPPESLHCFAVPLAIFTLTLGLSGPRSDKADAGGAPELLSCHVTGHDDDCVLEVHSTPLPIGQATVVENL